MHQQNHIKFLCNNTEISEQSNSLKTFLKNSSTGMIQYKLYINILYVI